MKAPAFLRRFYILALFFLIGAGASPASAAGVSVPVIGPVFTYHHADIVYGWNWVGDYVWDYFWDEESQDYIWDYQWSDHAYYLPGQYCGVRCYAYYTTRVPNSVLGALYTIKVPFRDGSYQIFQRTGNGGNIDVVMYLMFADTSGEQQPGVLPDITNDYYFSATYPAIAIRESSPALDNQPIEDSPSVTAQAFDAALDGGTRYCRSFLQNIVTALNPQTWADGAGSLVGYVTNIVDPATRTETVNSVVGTLNSLTVSQTWKDAADYLTTPEGLALVTSTVVLSETPSAFGTVKMPELPAALEGATAKTAIGATGRVGEEFLESIFAPGDPANWQKRFVTTEGGVRYVDVFDPITEIIYESKVGYTSLTSSIERQIAKDIDLLDDLQVKGVEWHFFVSPITGEGGPSGPLLQRLTDAGISVVIH